MKPMQYSPTARVPRGEVIRSALGLGPIPFRVLPTVLAIVSEARRGLQQQDGAFTHVEEAVHSAAVRRAQNALALRIRTRLEPLIHSIKALYAEINTIDKHREFLDEAPIHGPLGEVLSEDEAKQGQKKLRTQIDDETSGGSLKHVAERKSALSTVLMFLDLPLFFLAMTGLVNVSLMQLASMETMSLIKGLIALVFAVFATIGIYHVTGSLGRSHRAYKNAAGTLTVPAAARKQVIGQCVGLGLVLALLAAVMAGRVILEGTAAGAPLALMILLAIFLSAVIAGTAWLNYRNAFMGGGSLELDRLRQLAFRLDERDKQRQKLDAARTLATENAGIKVAALERAIKETRTSIEQDLAASKERTAVRIARSYTARHGALPVAKLDYTDLDLLTRQSTALREHHKKLARELPMSDRELEALFEL